MSVPDFLLAGNLAHHRPDPRGQRAEARRGNLVQLTDIFVASLVENVADRTRARQSRRALCRARLRRRTHGAPDRRGAPDTAPLTFTGRG